MFNSGENDVPASMSEDRLAQIHAHCFPNRIPTQASRLATEFRAVARVVENDRYFWAQNIGQVRLVHIIND